jgi:hypothetical protein
VHLATPSYILHKELLQPLVRQVDTELLEGVDSQPLESVDVQDADVVFQLVGER